MVPENQLLTKIDHEVILSLNQYAFKKKFWLRVLRNSYGKHYEVESIEQEWNIQLKCMKSLVFFSGEYTIDMHHLIQDMGRYVTKAVEAIWIHYPPNLCFSKEAMKI
ncbi:hypothetical protein H5410_055560 [Solanum commersonii]|uniref:Uncharacterized protein n=1 Tax=Solanum commersonii TaxID=4109 RepID=A0A9J5WIN0_SOLCO|nr:hypothetical protein H5410_055560 [Solanum commersonii]